MRRDWRVWEWGVLIGSGAFMGGFVAVIGGLELKSQAANGWEMATALGTVGATCTGVGIAFWQWLDRRFERRSLAAHLLAAAYPGLSVLKEDLSSLYKRFVHLENKYEGPESIALAVVDFESSLAEIEFPDPVDLIPLGAMYSGALGTSISHLRTGLRLAKSKCISTPALLPQQGKQAAEICRAAIDVALPRISSLADYGYEIVKGGSKTSTHDVRL